MSMCNTAIFVAHRGFEDFEKQAIIPLLDKATFLSASKYRAMGFNCCTITSPVPGELYVVEGKGVHPEYLWDAYTQLKSPGYSLYTQYEGSEGCGFNDSDGFEPKPKPDQVQTIRELLQWALKENIDLDTALLVGARVDGEMEFSLAQLDKNLFYSSDHKSLFFGHGIRTLQPKRKRLKRKRGVLND